MKGLIGRIATFSVLIHLSLALQCVHAAPPVEHFSRLPHIQKVELSPDGSKVAFIRNFQKEGISMLSALDINTGEISNLLKSDNEEIRINWFEWVNNETLVLSSRFAAKRYGTDTMETRLMALEADPKKTNARLLIKPRTGTISGTSQNFSQFQDNVIDFLPDDPEHIMVAVDLDEAHKPSVYKINVYTKKKKRIERGKLKIRDWMTDQQHRLRLGYSLNYQSGEMKIMVRQVDGKEWEPLFTYNAIKDPDIDPLGFDLDPNILYFTRYLNDFKALYKINTETKVEELVFSDPDHDVDGRLLYSRKTKGIIGITHGNTKTGRIYWDKQRSALQKGLDAALPDSNNFLIDFDQSEQIYILYSESDTLPGAYFYGNRKEGYLEILFEQYPEIDGSQLTEHKLVKYKARDGVEIEGYLTLPQNSDKPVATILHPHGGPGARDVDGFDYWTSFFSSRGYAVFRPNFRGSTGYGYTFAQSQMQAWGLGMQDDLTDAAHWLVDEGIADADRICIVGASYGGYAAMMGAAKTPDLFKCAVSYAGVMDLRRIVSNARKYTNREFVENQIGDDRKDLQARSPHYLAENIKVPVLLLHGKDDRVVDVKHSRNMAEELEDLNKDVIYIELENGDHYLSIQRNRHIAFKAMDEFLQTHLK